MSTPLREARERIEDGLDRFGGSRSRGRGRAPVWIRVDRAVVTSAGCLPARFVFL